MNIVIFEAIIPFDVHASVATEIWTEEGIVL